MSEAQFQKYLKAEFKRFLGLCLKRKLLRNLEIEIPEIYHELLSEKNWELHNYELISTEIYFMSEDETKIYFDSCRNGDKRVDFNIWLLKNGYKYKVRFELINK